MKQPFNEFDKDATEELKYASQFSFQCVRCEEHVFHLLPTGHVKCAMCGLIYCFIGMTKEWVYTTTDVFEEKKMNGETYSDSQQKFIPFIEKIEEEIRKRKRKRKRGDNEHNI